jgi:hypothetical protein
MTGGQWPRPFSREDRPAGLIHLVSLADDNLTACRQPVKMRHLTVDVDETNCVLCLRVTVSVVVAELAHTVGLP